MTTNPIGRAADVLGSTIASGLRGWTGVNTHPARVRPAEPLQLYEFEACPFCRLVREALTELDLDALVYPCPKRGKRFRPRVIEMGGKAQFPFLVDPNTGEQMYESLDIVAYLYETYGQRPLPLKWRLGPLQVMGSTGAGLARIGRGRSARASHMPAVPLELYSFESSPFARPVRELLCELELPYIVRSAGRSSVKDWIPPPVRDALNIVPDSDLPNRRALLERAGRVTIPYLVDPNTGTELGESTDICAYLEETYAA